MKFGIHEKGMDEVQKSIDKLPINPKELAEWVNKIELTAKQLCNDSENNITFKHIEGINLNFSVRDPQSRDCLIRSIETYLPSIPLFLRNFFDVFRNDLKNMKFNP